MNPLYNMFGMNNQNGQFPSGMIQQFYQYWQNFQGDPEQRVRNLINSGQMSQEQFNQLSSVAQMFQQFIK